MRIPRRYRPTRKVQVVILTVVVVLNVMIIMHHQEDSVLSQSLCPSKVDQDPSVFQMIPSLCKYDAKGHLRLSGGSVSTVNRTRRYRRRGPRYLYLPQVRLYNTMLKNWTFNASAANEFRSTLRRNCSTSELFVVTKKNVRINETIRYEAALSTGLNITAEMYARFPESMPYSQQRFGKCSIVGNSGIVSGSGCGKSIDSADFVIRSNFARVRNYTEDVGNKTNLMSCNPTIILDRYQGLNTSEWKKQFARDVIKEYGQTSLWIPAFSSPFCTDLAFLAQDTLRNVHIPTIFPHPEHFIQAREFWQHNGISAVRISTGMMLITGAMNFCEEVHIYGFWSYPDGPTGKLLNYHYFDPSAIMYPAWKARRHWHHMHSEFKYLVALHNQGAIHLHIDEC